MRKAGCSDLPVLTRLDNVTHANTSFRLPKPTERQCVHVGRNGGNLPAEHAPWRPLNGGQAIPIKSASSAVMTADGPGSARQDNGLRRG